MIYVVATVHLKPEHRDAFIKIFKANVPAVLAEEGCIEYQPVIDFDAGLPTQDKEFNTMLVLEKWESYKHLEAHFIAPHMKAYQQEVKGMVDKVSIKILEAA